MSLLMRLLLQICEKWLLRWSVRPVHTEHPAEHEPCITVARPFKNTFAKQHTGTGIRRNPQEFSPRRHLLRGAQEILRHSCDGGGNYGLRYFRCHATFFTIPKYSQELLRPRELGRRIHSLFPRAS